MKIRYIEPFEGGSHAAFTRALTEGLPDHTWQTLTLPARYWKWRMRGAAPWFALERRDALSAPCDVMLASSYLALAELRGLVPGLAAVPTALYFHENQLAYPIRNNGERDHHFGFTQLTSALAATRCVFNSAWNLRSFLDAARALLGRLPDAVPAGWVEAIEARSEVLPVPLPLPDVAPRPEAEPAHPDGPILLWNHRWEYDKKPEAFFEALDALHARGVPFRLAVCGQRFRHAPTIFEEARERHAARIIHWGYAESREDCEALLDRAHIVISTAIHEFFGIAMLEATHHGVYPLVPARLAYPELFPEAHTYAEDADLAPRLDALIRRWMRGDVALRADRRAITRPYLSAAVLPRYEALLQRLAGSG